MKYFFDTEFLEDTQKRPFGLRGRLGNFLLGPAKPTIDLISIGIVSQKNDEYYAVSKDFNLKEAWNRYQWKRRRAEDGMAGPYKEYWIRDNVLKRHKDYPQQLNEHHALHDARWNQSLYNFLKNFKR